MLTASILFLVAALLVAVANFYGSREIGWDIGFYYLSWVLAIIAIILALIKLFLLPVPLDHLVKIAAAAAEIILIGVYLGRITGRVFR